MKIKFILFLVLGIILGFVGCIVYTKVANTPRVSEPNFIDKGEMFTEDSLSYRRNFNYGYKPDSGFIPNAKVAYEVAMDILYPIYGNKTMLAERPFNIELENNKYWIISGSLDSTEMGGVVEILLRKNDGCVMAVSHGK